MEKTYNSKHALETKVQHKKNILSKMSEIKQADIKPVKHAAVSPEQAKNAQSLFAKFVDTFKKVFEFEHYDELINKQSIGSMAKFNKQSQENEKAISL